MSEKYTAPYQPDPETCLLTKGDEATISVEYELYSAPEIGIPKSDGVYEFSVVGEVWMPGETEETYAGIAVVKSNNSYNGAQEIFLVGLDTDAAGNKQIIKGLPWTEVRDGKTYTIGRGTEDDRDRGARHVNGGQLFGKPFSDFVSREHLKINLTPNGVRVIDSSSNNTHVTGFMEPKPVTEAKLITVDDIPSTNQELVGVIPESVSSAELAREERAKQLMQEIDELKAGFSEADSMALWRYAAGHLNKREAQIRGNGQESINFGKMAGQGYNEMSEAARQISSEYLKLFTELDKIRSDSREE